MPRPRGTRETVARGIYRDAIGYSVQVSVRGQRVERRFPAATSLATLIAHREDLRADLRKRRARRARGEAVPGTLAADAPLYLALPAVKAMPAYADRARHIAAWVEALGTVRRDDLTAVQIDRQLDAWTAEHHWQPATANQYRTALSNLYRRLDGTSARNPVRDVARRTTRYDDPRAIPVLALARILAAFRPGTRARVRLAMMATTGATQSELRRLRAEDIDLAGGVIRFRARRKGKGAPPRVVPLTRHSRLVVRWFIARGCVGRMFGSRNLRREWLAAKTRAGYGAEPWTPYDLRHTFGTALATAAKDERAVQLALGHTRIETTARYTLGAAQARVAAAVQALDPPRARKTTAPKTAPSRKRRKSAR